MLHSPIKPLKCLQLIIQFQMSLNCFAKVTDPKFKKFLIKSEIKALHLKVRFSASINECMKTYTR